MALDYTEAKGIVPAGREFPFFATPRRESRVAYFTIAHSFPRLLGQLAAVYVRDLLIGNESMWVPQSDQMAAEAFSDLAAPVNLTLPTVSVQSRIELRLFNGSKGAASVAVRFYWAVPQ